MSFSKGDYLDKDILDTPLGLTPKTQVSQVYQYYDITTFSPKNRKA